MSDMSYFSILRIISYRVFTYRQSLRSLIIILYYIFKIILNFHIYIIYMNHRYDLILLLLGDCKIER